MLEATCERHRLKFMALSRKLALTQWRHIADLVYGVRSKPSKRPEHHDTLYLRRSITQ